MNDGDGDEDRFRFDKSLSLGDVMMGLSLLVAGVLAFAALSSRVDVTEVLIQQVGSEAERIENDLRIHKIESTQNDSMLKTEFRDSVREINTKIDRLIEREINGNGKVH